MDVLQSVDFNYTPLEIIQVEQEYPGLWNDCMTELWQRRLIKEQVEAERGDRE